MSPLIYLLLITNILTVAALAVTLRGNARWAAYAKDLKRENKLYRKWPR